MIEQISHVCFSCKDITKTKIFYTKILKFKLIHEFKNQNDEIYGIFLMIGKGTFLEFFQDKKIYLKKRNQFRHICFKVKNLKKFQSELKKHKIKLTLKRGRTDQTLQAWLKDPDDIIIELHIYDKKSKFFNYQKKRI